MISGLAPRLASGRKKRAQLAAQWSTALTYGALRKQASKWSTKCSAGMAAMPFYFFKSSL
jgi:hypothetical protein